MLKYEIKAMQGKRIVPVVVFEDESYSLLNEFLLAERSFRRELLSLVNEVDLNMSQSESFSGNAFSLEIGKDTCKITNDTDGRELEVATADFKQVIVTIFVPTFDQLRKRKKWRRSVINTTTTIITIIKQKRCHRLSRMTALFLCLCLCNTALFIARE